MIMKSHYVYSVELGLAEPERVQEFEAWYEVHLQKLLSVPGIVAAQRFRSLVSTDSPLLALYQLESPGALETPEYKSKAGPSSASAWKFSCWRRNIFECDGIWPDVGGDLNLVVFDGDSESTLGLVTAPTITMKPIALDRSVGIRLLAATQERAIGSPLSGWSTRIFAPISGRLRAPVNSAARDRMG